jgi:N utilization substance protein B
MSRRSRAREVVLQVLYQDDLNPGHDLHASEQFVRARLQNQSELVDFALGLLSGTRRNRPELDTMLVSRADNWSLRRMAATDRNILRLAAYELLFTETPGRVVINEAVELAKRFGSKQSAQFVNGVLDGLLSQKSAGDEPTS